MNATLPRFATLQTLRLRRRPPQPPSRSSSSQSNSPVALYPPPLPSPLSLPPSSPSPSTLIPYSSASPLPSPRPSSRKSSRSSRVMVPYEHEPDREREQAYLGTWIKHCPTLRRVAFLSGAEYKVHIPIDGHFSFTQSSS
jgi:hypothetical protein